MKDAVPAPAPGGPGAPMPQALTLLLMQLSAIDRLLQSKLQIVIDQSEATADPALLKTMARIRYKMGERYWSKLDRDWHYPAPDSPVLAASRLEQLVRRFALTRFERNLLLLCVLPVLDSRYWLLLGCLQGDGPAVLLTRELALSVLCGGFMTQVDEHASFAPEGALFRHRLLRWTSEAAQRGDTAFAAGAGVQADMAVYQYLLGKDVLPLRLSDRASWLAVPSMPDMHAAFTAQLASSFDLPPDRAPPLVVLQGEAGSGRGEAIARAFDLLRRTVLCLHVDFLPEDDTQAWELLALAMRTARMHGACLAVRGAAELAERSPGLLRQFAGSLHASGLAVVFLTEPASARLPFGDFSHALWSMPSCALIDLVARLRRCLRNTRLEQTIDLAALVKRYQVSADAVSLLVEEAHQYRAQRGAVALSEADLRMACSVRSQQNFGELARRTIPTRDFADLVIGAEPLAQLHELLAAVRQRDKVLRQGFAEKLGQATGVSALFYGDSGTGKTLSAEVLAGALGVDLITIDLSTVVNKYIGETEKNLSRIFDLAEKDSGVLFFDEADALFGKRSATKDAKDRHANIEVAYLLQRLEQYPGLVILSTNNRSHLDEAFNRRITFMVRFPFPDVTLRERLWRTIWPAAMALAADIDFAALARRAELTGANIRNVAVFAAWQAADQGADVSLAHVELGVRRELSKLGRL